MNKKEAKQLVTFAHNSVKGLKDSRCAVMVTDGADDAPTRHAFIYQLGWLLFHDEKPIFFMAPHGHPIPPRIEKIATAIVRYDPLDPQSSATELAKAMRHHMPELGKH